jgi:ubiquinone/menaquinone biosynthesis C-methylase UbiE
LSSSFIELERVNGLNYTGGNNKYTNKKGWTMMSVSTQWQLNLQAAERYEQILVPTILGPAAQALVERTPLQGGESVLDIGCGTGAAARFAAEKVGDSAQVVGIDINAGMITVAKSLPPINGLAIDWYVDSAYQLPMGDKTVDVAFCAQTLQFLDDKPAALMEINRVLKAGGRAALSMWCDIRENPYFHALVEAITRHISGQNIAMGLQAAFGLSEVNEIRSLLSEAGFKNVDIEIRRLDLEMPDLEEFVPLHISATPMAAGFYEASQTSQREVIREITNRLERYATGTGVRIPFKTYLTMAAKGG